MNKTVTPEQRAYILAHLNDRPRTAVMRAAGVSCETFYRIVRQAGGEIRPELNTRNPATEALVRQHYPHLSGHEIDRRFGPTRGTASRIAKRLGITHTAETLRRLHDENQARLVESQKQVDTKARARKWKARRRFDELRILEGKPQRSNHKFLRTPRRTYNAKNWLIRIHGYLQDPDEPYTLRYDAHTRRRPRKEHTRRFIGTEDYYEEKYHIQFKPYETTVDQEHIHQMPAQAAED